MRKYFITFRYIEKHAKAELVGQVAVVDLFFVRVVKYRRT
jgi:hypothetical protein